MALGLSDGPGLRRRVGTGPTALIHWIAVEALTDLCLNRLDTFAVNTGEAVIVTKAAAGWGYRHPGSGRRCAYRANRP